VEEREQIKFPRLTATAEEYLHIQATSASAERALSVGGQIINDETSSLHADTVDVRVSCKHWNYLEEDIAVVFESQSRTTILTITQTYICIEHCKSSLSEVG
jgi:hypothetical protein